MNVLRQLAGILSRWMDCVAAAVVTMLGWLASPRTVLLAEQPDGKFSIQAVAGKPPATPMQVDIADGAVNCSGDAAAIMKGSRIELAMRPEQFFFRALELPRRASEFLDGIVRAQIDRITPWNASEAVVGWSEPTDISNDRISVNVAAAARAQIVPLTQALGQLGAKSIAVFTAGQGAGTAKNGIKVFEQAAAGALEARKVRRVLVGVLLLSGVLAGLAVTAEAVIGGDLQSQQNDVSRRIAERRGIIRAGNDAVANSAMARLVRRKNQSPAGVIVLEAISNVLPDHTFVTEFRFEGDKVQIVGITSDAPSLIRLIEQSPHFSRASFFAPTTRAPSDPGDRFHIEARIRPVFSPPS